MHQGQIAVSCALDANTDGGARCVLIKTPGVLTYAFFLQLPDMSTRWSPNKTPA